VQSGLGGGDVAGEDGTVTAWERCMVAYMLSFKDISQICGLFIFSFFIWLTLTLLSTRYIRYVLSLESVSASYYLHMPYLPYSTHGC